MDSSEQTGAVDARARRPDEVGEGGFREHVPFATILLGFVLAGFVLRTRVESLPEALAGYQLFFQVMLAGFVLTVLKNEVGVRAYGLFAPMVISFMLLGAGPFWGLLLFLNIFVVALATYFALRPYRLGTAPRVATLLMVACLSTTTFLVLGDFTLLPRFFESATLFFPAITSAWYADRTASEIEERGWTVPSIKLLWTLLAIVAAYLVMASDPLVEWFMGSPEAWVGIVVLNIYVGSRTGLRLTEYVRFTEHIGEHSVASFVVAAQVWLHNLRARLLGVLGRSIPTETISDVLAMRRRTQYVERYNPPYLRPPADEKATIKQRLAALGIHTPETYGVIRNARDVAEAETILDGREEFVIKPSRGYGGEGIVVVSGRQGEVYETSKGYRTREDLLGHVRRIIDGQYSSLDVGGQALIEERIVPAAFFERLCGNGVPDIRVIVFQGYPVMAMTRLPTAESEGAANLHKGAIGVGLHIADGTPTQAYQQSHDRWLERHPDTGADLTRFEIPNWTTVLTTALEAAAASGLGYTGVDITLDEWDVPQVLEVNVRPGLGIQNATGAGLLNRLQFVESLPSEYEFRRSAEKVSLAREWDTNGWAGEPERRTIRGEHR